MSLAFFQDVQESSLRAKRPEDLHRLLARVTTALEFDGFAHGGYAIDHASTAPQQFVLTNYPAPWQETYFGRNYVAIDPVVAYCTSSLLPATWDDLRKGPFARHRRSHEMMEEASAFGLRHGAAIPIRASRAHWALLSFSSDRPLGRDLHRRLLLAQAILPHIYEAARQLFFGHQTRPATLTARERECLCWVADGKTTWEISQILRISQNTVLYHIKNAQEKLGACSRIHAIAKALRSELIR